MALALWIFLRLTILRLDQGLIWTIAVSLIFMIFVIRHAHFSLPPALPEVRRLDSSVRSLELWRLRISTSSSLPSDTKETRRELAQILVSIYASRKRIAVDYRILEAFRDRTIALPAAIHAFLFPEPKKTRWPWLRLPARGLTRRNIDGYYEAVEGCLDFLESFAEVGDERHEG
jgi:hypothetical protein